MAPSTGRPAEPGSMIRHAVAVVLLDTALLFLLAAMLPGFGIDGIPAGIATAVVIGILNSVLWPLVARLTLVISVVSLGLGSLVLNALIVGVVLYNLPWLRIDGFPEALLITVLLSLGTSILGSILAFDQDSRWYLRTVRRQVERTGRVNSDPGEGFLFLEIDGLAHDVLRRALFSGNAPNLSRLVRGGSHRLRGWETDWSSQTGACQAGILHGNNRDMPAFRWWDKELDRPIVTNHPKDAAELERRHSDGNGLLSDDGASRANILSGDAPWCQLTMSTVLERRDRLGRDYATYFSRPFAVLGTAFSAVVDILSEVISAIRSRRAGVEPSIHRGMTYALMRAWSTVVQVDLQVTSVITDMLAGRPAIYTTFLAYDEVAHHSGVERPETLTALRKVDRAIGRILKVLPHAARHYRVVVLSDHGQSQGATFLDRYGESLEDLVSRLTGASQVAEVEGDDEARAYLRASISEASSEESVTGRTLRAAGGSKALESGGNGSGDHRADLPEITVMASGNLGIIGFPRLPDRAKLDWIEDRYPHLIQDLVRHDGIGFLLVDSIEDGALVIGADGRNHLETGEIEGVDPLAPFGPNAAAHVLRTHRFSNCPDILLNSTYWTDLDEVAAFEELVGSHGGLGGMQSHPFVLHPRDLPWPDGEVIGAETVHRVFRGWQGADPNQV